MARKARREGFALRLEVLESRVLLSGVGAYRRLARLPDRGIRAAVPRITASFVPNDPMVGRLWGMDAARDVDIDAPEAWSITTGSPATIVAVLDTGIDLGHPEFAGRVWTNPGEVAANGVDDDGNGHVDDLHGWNFVSDTNDVRDDSGHGTHVSGTIAAAGNDGVGVAGVDWNATILPLKILAADGAGGVDTAIAAIGYAVQAGARVINASWTLDTLSRPLLDAIRDAGGRGVVFVNAAGNGGADNDKGPAGRARPSNMITVAAIDSVGRLASFSNYGKRSVDLAAPGVGIWSTVPGGYASYTGTSMATPHVSGVVALVAGLHPEYGAEQLVSRILTSTKPLGSLRNKTRTGGMVDAAYALGAERPATPSSQVRPRFATGNLATQRRRRIPRGPRLGLPLRAIRGVPVPAPAPASLQ